jgi:hypothetical protein
MVTLADQLRLSFDEQFLKPFVPEVFDGHAFLNSTEHNLSGSFAQAKSNDRLCVTLHSRCISEDV